MHFAMLQPALMIMGTAISGQLLVAQDIMNQMANAILALIHA
jgi:hypothetical protein